MSNPIDSEPPATRQSRFGSMLIQPIESMESTDSKLFTDGGFDNDINWHFIWEKPDDYLRHSQTQPYVWRYPEEVTGQSEYRYSWKPGDFRQGETRLVVVVNPEASTQCLVDIQQGTTYPVPHEISVGVRLARIVVRTGIEEPGQHDTPWAMLIGSANNPEEIIAVLRLYGLSTVAQRLSYLQNLAESDPDEPTISVESLRALALFLMSERLLSMPVVGIAQDGLMQTAWRLPDNGMIAMNFLDDGENIQFAAIPSSPTSQGVSDTLPKHKVMKEVQRIIPEWQLK